MDDVGQEGSGSGLRGDSYKKEMELDYIRTRSSTYTHREWLASSWMNFIELPSHCFCIMCGWYVLCFCTFSEILKNILTGCVQ